MNQRPFKAVVTTATPHSARIGITQRGLTLIEMMVALVLGLLIAAAAVAALIVGRQGFTSVDSSSQLRENARFASSIIQRITVQAGFENAAYGFFTSDKLPGLRGYDNALVTAGSGDTGLAHGNRSSCAVTDTSCVNGSDVLIVRYWGATRSGTAADSSMINCSGQAEPEGTDRAYSIFHVRASASGEPTLVCTYRDSSGNWQDVPLVAGVEGFQILYGVDNVTPNVGSADATTGADSIPDRYLHASQLDAAGAYNANNWSRVRSVRIGLLVRGPVGSAAERVSRVFNVLGDGYTDSTDSGAALTAPADGRLRQQLVFTIHLRNPQYSP
jgi:type IV pilus assembly protein PilW